jgi:hypothetical protein
MNFLQAVNRVLRTNSIIRGDDDEVATFSDTQHAATMNLAIIAIQDELNDLIADRVIPYEDTNKSASITLVAGTRAYALESNFVRFLGEHAFFREANTNRLVVEYPGGEDALRGVQGLAYLTDTGTPTWWYWENATTKQVAFYNVPNSTYDGVLLYYRYEKDLSVTNSSDTLPFQTEAEAQAFCGMASRRFKALLEESPDPSGYVMRDPSYLTAKSRLTNLIRPTNPSKNYGVVYR